jgi:drug/metabolite transporter (DMT)-like permease
VSSASGVIVVASRQINLTTVALIALIGSVLAISFSPTFIRLAQGEGLPALVIVTARLALSTLFFTPLVLMRYRHELRNIGPRDLLLAAVAGFWLGIHLVLLVTSLEHTSVLVSQVVVNTSPLWVALLEVFVLKARLPRLVWIGLALALIGGGGIGLGSLAHDPAAPVVPGGNPVLGSLAAFAAALTVAVYIAIGRKVRARVTLIPYLWLVFGFGAITVLAIVALLRVPVAGYSWQGYFWLVMVTVFAQIMGHSGFNFALRYFPATLVSIAGQAITLIASVVAFFVFREVPGALDVFGSLLILAGVCLALMRPHAAAQPPPSSDAPVPRT